MKLNQAHWLERLVIAGVALLWMSCVIHAIDIAVQDYPRIKVPREPKHPWQEQYTFKVDDATKEIKGYLQSRPLRTSEKFELLMSLGRSPKHSTEATVLLIVFVLSSQFLILQLTHLPSQRWLLFSFILVLGLSWTWYQITDWLEFWHVTFMSKTVGEPLSILLMPTCFFWYLAGNQCSSQWLFCVLSIQAALFYPFMFVWAWTMLILGWIWI